MQAVALEEPYLQLVDRLVLLEQGAAVQEQQIPQLRHRVQPIQAVVAVVAAETQEQTAEQAAPVS
jgi:ABC-type uncharacterized transport system ATPase subunit